MPEKMKSKFESYESVSCNKMARPWVVKFLGYGTRTRNSRLLRIKLFFLRLFPERMVLY